MSAAFVLRQILRKLVRDLAYTVMALLTLSLGLAAVATTFSLVSTILLRPLPFAHSERIVGVSEIIPGFTSGPTVDTPAEFLNWRKSGLFEHTAAIDTAEYTMLNGSRPERIYGAAVTPDFFPVFGIKPALGRDFTALDAQPNGSGVVILSHELWAAQFNSDPHIIGRSIRLDSGKLTVIGVMPALFDFPSFSDVSSIMPWVSEHCQFWTPLAITQKLVEEGNINYYVVGRLRPDVSLGSAAQTFQSIAVSSFKAEAAAQPAYRDLIYGMLPRFRINATPLQHVMVAPVRAGLWLLLCAVAFLLVLVLFNLGNLLLTKNAHRWREYSVRQALGAGRWQLFSEALAEHLVLTICAAGFALVLTYWSLVAIRLIAANRLPRLHELTIQPEVFAFLIGAACLTALAFGVLPQLVLHNSALAASLQSESRSATADRGTNRIKSAVMIAEIAFSVVLLVGAGLLLRSFANVLNVNPGFDAANVLALDLSFSTHESSSPAMRLQHVQELLRAFRSIPGVVSASVVNRLPLTGEQEIHSGIHAVGKPANQLTSAELRVVDPDYFKTLSIPLLAGRLFRTNEPKQFAIIDKKVADTLWPGTNAVGKQFADGDDPPWTVVGIVGNVADASLERAGLMHYYRTINAAPYDSSTFVLRTRIDPWSVLGSAQRAVVDLDPSEPITHGQTMQDIVQSITLQRRFLTWLIAGFAIAALCLAALGLFSVASLSSLRRTREFGIRMALGATGDSLVALELRRTLAVVLAGLLAGLLASALLAPSMRSLLYGVTSSDLRTYFSVAAVLLASALLAVWIPARRAGHVDPASALRNE